ncbi:uncharacterized protein RJT20DRAFT_128174 [Scheffersomyces xylosifermentans]|uniref:uncharacterized protein n=1 Tax=Scheffersomyces xylosifermentans TaxID=1304137 RepID=UPI00315DBA38
MDEQQEIGGAHALLQLGSKQKDDGIDDSIDGISHENDNGDNVNDNSNNNTGEKLPELNDDVNHSDDDLSDSKNQQINDAVEAAVMRYVGGTLDSAVHDSSSKRGKRKIHDEIINNIHDFNQWTGFLEDTINDNPNEDYEAYTQHQSPPQSKSSKKKKRRTQSGTSDIDPELEALDNTEHDQLVEAAIMDARELTRHIAGHDGHNNANVANSSDSISAITQLAQAATSISGAGYKKNTQKYRKSNIDTISNIQMKAAPTGHVKLRPKFNNLTSVESLVEMASAEACDWFNSLPDNTGKGPRKFSEVELGALDHFIEGYCHLHKWTREDVCNRIWSSERKKDNFWESLTRVLPYRSRASVYKHVRRQYHVFDVRAKWSKEDDDLLRKLALTHEGKWKQIGEAMGRMPEDCRDRWRNYVKCGENRTLNKWSEEEENSLKQIVTEMLQQLGDKEKESINWTIVSERMHGVRSRIQCRYKWSKLVKRESALRATYMNLETKTWLLHRLQRIGVQSFEEINWAEVARSYREEHPKTQHDADYDWDEHDFKASFEKIRSEIRDHKRLQFDVLLSRLLEDIHSRSKVMDPKLYGDDQRDEILKQLRVHKDSVRKQYINDGKEKSSQDKLDPNDPESIANAAVAAVSSGVEGVDAQQQAYSLWR